MTTIRSGDDVRFTGRGGYAKDRAKAKDVLVEGRVYRVSGVSRGPYFSTLKLYVAPGWFNTAMFEVVSPTDGAAVGPA
jgi:hypothetical protein